MNKIGLFYAGGAFTGAAFEASASLVLDDFMLNTSINDCAFYSGMSAGSIISTLLAAGIHPQGIIQHLDEHPAIIDTVLSSLLASFDVKSIGSKIFEAPGKLTQNYLKFLSSQVKRDHQVGWFDFIKGAFDSVAKRGLLSIQGLENFMVNILEKSHIPDDFNQLERNLILAGVNINTAKRSLFGKNDLEKYANKDDEFYKGAKISEGVAISCCFVPAFSPYEFREQYFVDGAMHDTAAMDIGLKMDEVQFGIVINPLSPLINQDVHNFGPLGILEQIYRIAIRTRLDLELKAYGTTDKELIHFHPGKENNVTFVNPFRYDKVRVTMVDGYVNMAKWILQHYNDYSKGLAKIGVQCTPDTLQFRIKEIESEKNLGKKLEVLLK